MMCSVVFEQEMQVNFCSFVSGFNSLFLGRVFQKRIVGLDAKAGDFKSNSEVCPNARSSLKFPCRVSRVWI